MPTNDLNTLIAAVVARAPHLGAALLRLDQVLRAHGFTCTDFCIHDGTVMTEPELAAHLAGQLVSWELPLASTPAASDAQSGDTPLVLVLFECPHTTLEACRFEVQLICGDVLEHYDGTLGESAELTAMLDDDLHMVLRFAEGVVRGTDYVIPQFRLGEAWAQLRPRLGSMRPDEIHDAIVTDPRWRDQADHRQMTSTRTQGR